MSEIIVGTYTEFKATLDMEMSKVADGVVKIGYLLKVARDTDILSNSGYKTVAEFAEAEYGMRKDAVSRYIAINDRYSLDGYSEELDTKYQGFGATKLSEMLTLPDTIIESITPDFTKEEIRTIKKEYTDETKISDMEVLLEEQPEYIHHDDGILQQVFREYGYENPQKFVELRKATKVGATAERIIDVIASSGYGVITVRIPGKGKYIMTIKGQDAPVDLLNVRENIKEQQPWGDIISAVIKSTSIYADTDQEAWEEIYGEPWKQIDPPLLPSTPAPEKKVTVEPSKKPDKTKQKPKPDKTQVEKAAVPKPEPEKREPEENTQHPAETETSIEDVKEKEETVEIIPANETIVEGIEPDPMQQRVIDALDIAMEQAASGNLQLVIDIIKPILEELETHLKTE